MWGVQSDFASPFAHSGWVQFLDSVVPMICSAVRTTLRSLLRSDLVAEMNQTVIEVQRTDSMMAELFQQLLWQVTNDAGILNDNITDTVYLIAWSKCANKILKMSYDAILKIIILCIWCNRICWHALMFKKHIIFQILYFIVYALPLSKRIAFYKSPQSEPTLWRHMWVVLQDV